MSECQIVLFILFKPTRWGV